MLPIIALRGAGLAALMSFFGVLVFVARLDLPQTGQPPALRRRLRWLGGASAVLAIVLGAGWFVLEARSIAGAGSLGETVSALIPVALGTQFGPWLLLRLVLVAAALLLAGSVPRLGLGLAAVALAMQPMLAHAGAIDGQIGWLMIGSEALHMLAAGAWLGGLLPLAVSVTTLAAPVAAVVCRRFSTLALAAVLLLLGSGLFQAEVLLGSARALVTAADGHALALKLGLVVVALALAALNRFDLARRLVVSIRARRWLPRSVRVEAAIGLCIVLVAAWLASLAPAADPNLAWSRGRLALAAVAALLAVVALATSVRPGRAWRANTSPLPLAALGREADQPASRSEPGEGQAAMFAVRRQR